MCRRVGVLLGICLLAGCATANKPKSLSWPRYTLRAEQYWQLNSPQGERFDASGLLLTPAHELLTVNDRGPSIYRVEFPAAGNSANLVLVTNAFTPQQLRPFAREKIGHYDCEGIAQDEAGRIYLCEEANRWVLRWDPKTKTVERLNIDWAPVNKYFSSTDRNASFEGVAISGGRLYLANERSQGRIIVVDLHALKVIDDFAVRPSGSLAVDVHYSDLCYFENALFVLLREGRIVLKVDPVSHRVLAEYNYHEVENASEVAYYSLFFWAGVMEGLAVDADNIWLVTDNNGLGRLRHPNDIRPTLFRCARPDKEAGASAVRPGSRQSSPR
jgi:hypothetical protein